MIEPTYQYRHKIPVIGYPGRSKWSTWYTIDQATYEQFAERPSHLEVRQVWLMDAEPVATNAELMALLPGAYYMDPPDGGGPGVLEQLQRMAQDAARFRALRAHTAPMRLAESIGIPCPQVTHPGGVAAIVDDMCDALIKELEE